MLAAVIVTGGKLMTQPASGTQPETVPPGTYTLDTGRTTIRADVKALFGLMTVRGVFRLTGGQISITPDLGSCVVQASIEAASYSSGFAVRDADVVSAALLDARTHPQIIFTGRGARRDGGGWVVTGSVTAHGTVQPVQVRVSDAQLDGGTARFRATARLDRASFGITKKKGLVGRRVDLLIEAVAEPS
jgi:polyisoprenoid-binding protein YceI